MNDISHIIERLSTVTQQELDSINEDETGAKYSPDGKRLLWVNRTITGAFVVKDGVSIICKNAFSDYDYCDRGCNLFSNIISIDLPPSLKIIGCEALAGCRKLCNIVIPNGVTYIGNFAFAGCGNLSSIHIPGSVMNIGGGIFMNCDNVLSISVDTDNLMYDSRNECNAIIETISNTLILGCKNTEIPQGITSIGQCAFWQCFGLTSLHLPESLLRIGDYAFYNCKNITSIVVPDNVEEIGCHAFCSCDKLSSVSLPRNLTKVGEGAFDGCYYPFFHIIIPKGTYDKFEDMLNFNGLFGLVEE